MSVSRQICAGIDLGGTKIAVLLGRRDGTILAHDKIRTDSTRDPDQVFESIAELLEKLSGYSRVELGAIGIGVPGLVDRELGKIEFLPNLPGKWNGFPASQFLGERMQKPVFLLNDARLAALGEYTYGIPPKCRDLLVVTVGTGIGGGLILDGRLRLGVCGASAEIGHHTILPDGEVCSCGSRGCLETLINGRMLTAQGIALARAGAAPMLSALVGGDWSAITPKEMAVAAKSGDSEIASVIETAARYLGIGIANAISLTGVERVVLCGGVSAIGDALLEPVRAEVRYRVRMLPASRVRIECSTLGDNAGALGALALAFQNQNRSSFRTRAKGAQLA